MFDSVQLSIDDYNGVSGLVEVFATHLLLAPQLSEEEQRELRTATNAIVVLAFTNIRCLDAIIEKLMEASHEVLVTRGVIIPSTLMEKSH